MSNLQKAVNAINRRVVNAWPTKPIIGRLTAPIASISFDDFPHSAWAQGGSILEAAGVQGTYYVSRAFAPANQSMAQGRVEGVQYYELDDIVEAHKQGHEIGCHSFQHVNLPELTNAQIEQSIDDNAEFIRHLLGDVVMTSFAYPQGQASLRTKKLLSKRFAVSRGTSFGLNSGVFDFSKLSCIELLPDILQKKPIAQLIEKAKSANAWLIFATHDVTDSPSPWGCTPELLRSLVSELCSHGIEILPVKSAAAKVVFPDG